MCECDNTENVYGTTLVFDDIINWGACNIVRRVMELSLLKRNRGFSC